MNMCSLPVKSKLNKRHQRKITLEWTGKKRLLLQMMKESFSYFRDTKSLRFKTRLFANFSTKWYLESSTLKVAVFKSINQAPYRMCAVEWCREEMNPGQIFTLKFSRTTCRTPSVDSAEQLLHDCGLHLLQVVALHFRKSSCAVAEESVFVNRRPQGEQLDFRNGTNITNSTFFLTAYWCGKNKKQKPSCFSQTGRKKKKKIFII